MRFSVLEQCLDLSRSHCTAPLFVAPESVPSGESQSVAGGDEDALDDYQELSTREEQDIESMMEMCEYAISNAEAFAEQLSRELQVLDGVSGAHAKYGFARERGYQRV